MKQIPPLFRSLRACSLAFASLAGWIAATSLPAHGAVLVDPSLVAGSGAVDPAGQQTIDKIASGATPLATLLAQPGLAAVQDFTGWGFQTDTNYLVFQQDPTRADVKALYSNVTGIHSGGSTTDPNLNTSPGASIRLNSGSTRTAYLTLDFGSATYDGTAVTAFDSTAKAPVAVGFTVCGLAGVTGNVTVTFYGTDDATILSTQTLATGSDPDAGDGTTGGSDGYVAFLAAGTGVGGGVGKVVIIANQIIGGPGTIGLGIDDLAFTGGRQYFVTVAGAGTKDGSSWANALPAKQLSTTVNTTMVPGDTVNLGSGNYGITNLGTTTGALSFTSSGAINNPLRLTGVDTGGGLPTFDAGNWSRTAPTTGKYSLNFTGTSSYWEVDNLVIRNCVTAVSVNASSSTPHNGLTFYNVQVSNARYGFYISDADNLAITDCSVINYTKHAFRLEAGCDTVLFRDCLADLSNGDSSWWDYSEAFPFGWTVGNPDAATGNSGVTFANCISRNNRRNNQNIGYWNGDGFSMELNTGGTTAFTNCVAVNNEDGGFDIKCAATFTSCSAVRNHRGFRLWDSAKTLTNCIAAYPFSRSNMYPNGVEGGDGVWGQNATATLDFFTFHGNDGFALHIDGTGSFTLTNSIVSFTGTKGSFSYGNVSFGAGTVMYRPGSGINPSYINPTPAWDGTGDDLNSQIYGTTKGWYAP